MKGTPRKVLEERDGRNIWNNSTPQPLTPLRKNSSFNRPLGLTENRSDDREERNKRRSLAVMQKRLSTMQNPALPSYTPHIPAGEKEIKEHFDVCLKMFAENKINVKNAWNLKIIDYMSAMVSTCGKKNSLQVGSASLDVSTKVYSIRVDDVHSEGFKLASAMSRTTREEIENDNEINNDEPLEEQPHTAKQRKKKKKSIKNKHTISKDENNLVGEISKIESATFQTRTNSDWSSVDNFFTSKLMNDVSGTKFMFLSSNKSWESEADEDPILLDSKSYLRLETRFSNKVEICREFHTFEVDNWDPDKDDHDDFMDASLKNNELVFDDNGIPMADLDGSIHDIFNEPANHMDYQSEEEICGHAGIRGDIVNIDNFQPINEEPNANDYLYQSITTDKFFSQIWAGPNHWKLKHLHRKKPRFTGVNIVNEKQVRKKPQQDDVSVDFQAFDELLVNQPMKKVTGNYNPFADSSQIFKPLNYALMQPVTLFSKPSILLKNKSKVAGNNGLNYECSPYHYDNPDDNDYCAQNLADNVADDEDDGLHDSLNMEIGGLHQSLSGINLIDKPETVHETYISFSTKAKKMDMRKLKSKIWDIMNTDWAANEGVINFSKVHNNLPSVLNQSMKEELSCPLTFIAVLHLANEENLKLTGSGDMSDFTVERDPGPNRIDFFN